MANVEAFEDCTLLVLKRHDYNFIFGEDSDLY